MTCKDCKFYEKECESHSQMRTIGHERSIEVCELFRYKPKTNADRIRAMTDEELADLFRKVYNAGCDDCTAYAWGNNKYSFVWNEEWLQQPCEED